MCSSTVRVRARVETRPTYLLRKLDKVFFAVVCACTRLKKSANSEKSKKNFEDGATRIVLMRRFDITSYDMRSGYFKKCRLCLYESIR